MNIHVKQLGLFFAAILLWSNPVCANQGIDSSPNTDLPISAGGSYVMTICGGGDTNPACGGVAGRILFGPDPKNPTAWIDTRTGVTSFIPAGAVMAFNLASGCPTGWAQLPDLAGKTVIGAGSSTGLTPRSYGDTGGAETHTLTVAEMPSHNHNTVDVGQVNWGAGGFGQGSQSFSGGGSAAVGSNPPWFTTSYTGGGGAHNIMMPWVALYYCQKT